MKAKEFLDCFFELLCFSKSEIFVKTKKRNEKRLITIIKQDGDVYGDAIEILHEIDFGFGDFLSSAFIYELLKLAEFDEDETIHAINHYKFSGEQLLDICKNSREAKICQAAFAKNKMTPKQLEKLRRYFRVHNLSIFIAISDK
ncbi:MAG: hypothetical protein PHP62_03275 [Candidatus Moranbacteria bacterium]|nr:hypothetical protein [Candidatus Moranbacteria bacterium]